MLICKYINIKNLSMAFDGVSTTLLVMVLGQTTVSCLAVVGAVCTCAFACHKMSSSASDRSSAVLEDERWQKEGRTGKILNHRKTKMEIKSGTEQSFQEMKTAFDNRLEDERMFDDVANRHIGKGMMGSVAGALLGAGIPVDQINDVLGAISSHE